MSIRGVLLLFILVVSAVIGICTKLYWSHYAGQRDFQSLLAGENDLTLVVLEFKGQGKQATLDDPNSLVYLTEMVKSAKVAGGTGRATARPVFGRTYYMHVQLSSGAWVKCAVYVPERRDCLTLHYPIDDFGDGVLYLVNLREPIPEPLSRVLSQLR